MKTLSVAGIRMYRGGKLSAKNLVVEYHHEFFFYATKSVHLHGFWVFFSDLLVIQLLISMTMLSHSRFTA